MRTPSASHPAQFGDAVAAHVEDQLSSAPLTGSYRDDVGAALRLDGNILSAMPDLRWARAVLVCCDAAGGRGERSIPTAAAVEMFMVALDMLDDFEDREEGELERRIGAPRALNVTTGLQLLAQRCLLGSADGGTAAQILLEGGLRACCGQHADLGQVCDGTGLDGAWGIAAGKSGSLAAAICRLGALAGGADGPTQTLYARFGRLRGGLRRGAGPPPQVRATRVLRRTPRAKRGRERRGDRDRGADLADREARGGEHMAGGMEQAELVGRLRPHRRQHRRIERRLVGDHLFRLDARSPQAPEERGNIFLAHRAPHQLVADQPVAGGRRGIHRQQQGEVALIEFVHAEHARERTDDPCLVVRGEVELARIAAAPHPNHGLTRADPAVLCQALLYPTDRHAVAVDRLHGHADDPVGRGSARAQEWGLGPEIVATGGAVMHAHRHQQQDRLVQIEVDRRARSIPDAGGELLAAATGQYRQAVAHVANLAGDLVEGEWRGRHGGTISYADERWYSVVAAVYHPCSLGANANYAVSDNPFDAPPFNAVSAMVALYEELTSAHPVRKFFVPVPRLVMPPNSSLELARLVIGPLSEDEWVQLSKDIRHKTQASSSGMLAANFARSLVAPRCWARAEVSAGQETARAIVEDRLINAIAILHAFSRSPGVEMDPNAIVLGEALEPTWETAFSYYRDPELAAGLIFQTIEQTTDRRRDYELSELQLDFLRANPLFLQAINIFATDELSELDNKLLYTMRQYSSAVRQRIPEAKIKDFWTVVEMLFCLDSEINEGRTENAIKRLCLSISANGRLQLKKDLEAANYGRNLPTHRGLRELSVDESRRVDIALQASMRGAQGDYVRIAKTGWVQDPSCLHRGT